MRPATARTARIEKAAPTTRPPAGPGLPVNQFNPARGQRLLAAFARVDWPAEAQR